MHLKKLVKHRLSNGLTVIYGHLPETSSFEISMHINTGSRDESPDTSGISHVLEHMMFRGSSRHPDSIELAKAMEDLGGDSNAITGYEHTLYWLRGSVKKIKEGFELFSDFFLHPQFKDFETERQIILQELASDYNEKNLNIDPESLAMEQLFGEQNLGLSIIGQKQCIENITIQQLHDLRAEKYHPQNCVLTITAPSLENEIIDFATKHFSHQWEHCKNKSFEPRKLVDTKKFLSPTKKHVNRIKLQTNSDNQYMLKLLFPCFGGNSDEVIIQTLIQKILDDGISSRLQSTIRETHGLVYDISCETNPFQEMGTFSIDVTVAQENIEKLFEILKKELKFFAQNGPTHEEIERARFRYLFELESLPENHSRVLSREVWNMFVGEDYSVERESQVLSNLDAPTLVELTNRILRAPVRAAVLIGPKARRYRKALEDLLEDPGAKA